MQEMQKGIPPTPPTGTCQTESASNSPTDGPFGSLALIGCCD
jgi:hypothetical protein